MADPMSDVDDPVAALCTALVTYIQHQAARENAAEAVRLDMQARIARLEASADGVRNAVNRESQQRQNAVSNAVPTSESRQTGFDATDVTGAQHHDDNPDSTAQEPPVSTRDTPTIQDGDQAAIDTPDTDRRMDPEAASQLLKKFQKIVPPRKANMISPTNARSPSSDDGIEIHQTPLGQFTRPWLTSSTVTLHNSPGKQQRPTSLNQSQQTPLERKVEAVKKTVIVDSPDPLASGLPSTHHATLQKATHTATVTKAGPSTVMPTIEPPPDHDSDINLAPKQVPGGTARKSARAAKVKKEHSENNIGHSVKINENTSIGTGLATEDSDGDNITVTATQRPSSVPSTVIAAPNGTAAVSTTHKTTKSVQFNLSLTQPRPPVPHQPHTTRKRRVTMSADGLNDGFDDGFNRSSDHNANSAFPPADSRNRANRPGRDRKKSKKMEEAEAASMTGIGYWKKR